jgi:hypothetical protein
MGGKLPSGEGPCPNLDLVLAVVPTLIAILAGLALGISGGGRIDNLWAWRPIAWRLAVIGLALQLLFKVLPLSGGLAVVIDIVSMAALIAFALLNIRVGGMVLVVIGLSLNLFTTVVDWGTPVRAGSLVSAGLVTQSQLDDGVGIEGPRHLQRTDDRAAWLGEVIPLPTHQVIALGDLVLLLGEALVVSSLVRKRRVERSGSRRATRRRGKGGRTPSGRGPTRRPPSRGAPSRWSPAPYVEEEIDLREPVRRRY